MNLKEPLISSANVERFDEFLDNINQAYALVEIGLSLDYANFSNKVLFYYLLTINNLLEKTCEIANKFH